MTHRAHTVLTLALLVLLGMAVYRIYSLNRAYNQLVNENTTLTEQIHQQTNNEEECGGEESR